MSKIIDLIDSYIDRDPAAKGRIETLVTSPGLHSIGIYKLSNFLWSIRLTILARLLSYIGRILTCLLYTSPSPRDISGSRMPSSA